MTNCSAALTMYPPALIYVVGGECLEHVPERDVVLDQGLGAHEDVILPLVAAEGVDLGHARD
jgi:hypothetical protein